MSRSPSPPPGRRLRPLAAPIAVACVALWAVLELVRIARPEPVPPVVGHRVLARVPAVLVFGDSLAAGFGTPHPERDGVVALLATRCAVRRPGCRFTNRAVPGRFIRNVLPAETPRARVGADVVLVIVGGNDVRRAELPPEISTTLGTLLDRLRARYPHARVVVTDIPDVSRVPAVPAFARAPFHALIALDDAAFRQTARAHGAIVLPLFDITASVADDPSNYSDGMHPSALGAERLSARLWPAFARALDL